MDVTKIIGVRVHVRMGWCTHTNEKVHIENYHFMYDEDDNGDDYYDDFDDDDLDSPF